ncbi:MAG: PilZ domain-containing protein [Gammaproteobacteria bacterium]|nr:PilZ domain-containing protein [Gammaproteobacteria bacterium]
MTAVLQQNDQSVGEARLLVAADILVKSSNTLDWVPAELRDISRVGARLVVEEYLGGVGDAMELRLRSRGIDEVTVGANIVAVSLQQQGSLLDVAFRFSDTIAQTELDGVLAELLSHGGGGRRVHVRVAYRMEIQYGDQAELRAILEDISKGGFLMLTVHAAPEVGQSVRVVIPSPYGPDDLRLKARVVRHEGISTDDGPATLVGLQFEDIGADRQEKISVLIDTLLFLRSEPN